MRTNQAMSYIISPPKINAKAGKLDLYALTFDLPLRPCDIPSFRGAIADIAGWENDLFHNHDKHKNSEAAHKHRYPLIQYRVQEGKAAILGINDGAEALEDLHRSKAFSRFCINGEPFPLQVIDRSRERGTELRVTESTHRYRLYQFVPFRPDSYRRYKNTPELINKIPILEHLLQNHIVSFAYAMDWRLPEAPRVKVTVNDLDRVRKVRGKETYLMGFDLVFSMNVLLPEGVGLGRNTAFGYGRLMKMD